MISQGVEFAFSFYERHRHRQLGRLDRDVRRPDLLLAWAGQRRLLPPAGMTTVITGSKGKGSVARLTAWGLASHGAGPVGLLVSPEECSHLDRIRIDNRPIPAHVFETIVEQIRVELEVLQNDAPATFYLPPTAVFLAVALCWWQAQGVRACVIEGGRGARWDEIGSIPARLGIVTAILPEHLGKLGPTLAEVAADKLSLAIRVDELLCPADLRAQAELTLPRDQHAKLRYIPTQSGVEGWYPVAHALAEAACATLLCRSITLPAWPVPSFYRALLRKTPDGRDCDCEVLLDGSVLSACLAPRLADVSLRPGAAVVLGLADDKDAAGLLATARLLVTGPLYAVRLHSACGHVESQWLAGSAAAVTTLGVLDVVAGVSPELTVVFSDLMCKHCSLVFVGVQTFLRSVRNLLALEIAQPVAPALSAAR